VDEHRLLADLERLLGREISRRAVAGFEPDPRIRPEPIERGRRSGTPTQGRARAGAPRQGRRPRSSGAKKQRICP